MQCPAPRSHSHTTGLILMILGRVPGIIAIFTWIVLSNICKNSDIRSSTYHLYIYPGPSNSIGIHIKCLPSFKSLQHCPSCPDIPGYSTWPYAQPPGPPQFVYRIPGSVSLHTFFHHQRLELSKYMTSENYINFAVSIIIVRVCFCGCRAATEIY